VIGPWRQNTTLVKKGNSALENFKSFITEEEEKDAKDALNVAPVVISTFEDLCDKSIERVNQALLQRVMKDSIGN